MSKNDIIDEGKANKLYKKSSPNKKGAFTGKGNSNSFK